MRDELTPTDAIKLAELAGLDTTDLRRQVEAKGTGSSVERLTQRLEALEKRVAPEEPEPGRALADALQSAQSPWTRLGGDRG